MSGHTALIYSVTVIGGNVYSGSQDNSVRQWVVANGTFLASFAAGNWASSLTGNSEFLFVGVALVLKQSLLGS